MTSNDFDSEDQLQPEDSLNDQEVGDVLDRGFSTAEKWSVGEGFGNTPFEEATGETLDQRMRQEEPEADPYAELSDDDQEEDDEHEVGNRRAGRLVDPDEGLGEDYEKDLVGNDIGIDGAAASAEEAAMHIIDDDSYDD
jgi:hypothetical protein